MYDQPCFSDIFKINEYNNNVKEITKGKGNSLRQSRNILKHYKSEKNSLFTNSSQISDAFTGQCTIRDSNNTFKMDTQATLKQKSIAVNRNHLTQSNIPFQTQGHHNSPQNIKQPKESSYIKNLQQPKIQYMELHELPNIGKYREDPSQNSTVQQSKLNFFKQFHQKISFSEYVTQNTYKERMNDVKSTQDIYNFKLKKNNVIDNYYRSLESQHAEANWISSIEQAKPRLYSNSLVSSPMNDEQIIQFNYKSNPEKNMFKSRQSPRQTFRKSNTEKQSLDIWTVRAKQYAWQLQSCSISDNQNKFNTVKSINIISQKY
ncbi:UNKNOWN [Stylonychia lemnae]|uniref:Uncharacterized protein n=1 Tax=Stylonychia lemnae TaxID=5949 RepID=A0A078AZY5_STYLE|nr:UNKNOWN [Stylonychia lemnae]|eukprot:CDW86348.1 UNKNOWN [Stylonychia lemnae]